MHTESTHRVTRGGDHAASAGAADDERLALEFRPIPLLHRRIKRVHVDMQNRAGVATQGVSTPGIAAPQGRQSTVMVIFFECSGGSKDIC